MASLDPDYLLALTLQAKYNKEEALRKRTKSKENAVVHLPSASLSRPVANSLVDPIWETTDPTPDVHALFLAFNKRFFWGALDSVEVCWSPRLKLCAGVCTYQNKSGFCSVRLSAPLLKLRPRSDLIETLLHELIHAYLFVTNNDRDRDGHGPVFQSHMRRINKEAGTNITIYHNFHDEVELYQQHWWRCDGPCQNRRPYFGFVKRSMNRAPGPNDIWWAEHRANCSGKFIKIKEPVGFNKNKKLSDNQNTKSSQHPKITGFFTASSPSSSVSNVKINNKSISSNTDLSKNVVGFKDLTNRQVASPHDSKNSATTGKNVYGFKDYTNSNHNIVTSTGVIGKTVFPKPQTEVSTKSKTSLKTPRKSSTSFQRDGILANRGSGTFFVTSKDQRNKEKDNKECKTSIVPFSGAGYVLGNKHVEKSNAKSNSEMFSRNERILGKSKASESIHSKAKQPKLETFPEVFDMDDQTEDSCHDYNTKVSRVETNSQPDNCVNLNDEADKICNCPVCNVTILRSSMSSHFEDCIGLSNIFNDSSLLEVSDEETDESNKVPCPCCDKKFEETEINKHLDECLNVLLLSELN